MDVVVPLVATVPAECITASAGHEPATSVFLHHQMAVGAFLHRNEFNATMDHSIQMTYENTKGNWMPCPVHQCLKLQYLHVSILHSSSWLVRNLQASGLVLCNVRTTFRRTSKSKQMKYASCGLNPKVVHISGLQWWNIDC